MTETETDKPTIAQPDATAIRRAKKRAVLEVALKAGPALVQFAIRPGVEVPEGMSRAPVAALSFSPRFDGADLVLDDQGIRQTLSFTGLTHLCVVPWDAIWAVASDQDDSGCAFFPEDVPPAQVAAFFDQLIQQRVLIARMSASIQRAISLHDSGAGSGSWRSWRASLEEPAAPPSPKKAPPERRLIVVPGSGSKEG